MRQRPPDRLDQLVAAALRVFAEKGYRRTQMADVARAMNVAPGTLYRYVASKEALFHLVIDRALLTEPASESLSLPIPPPSPGATLQRLRQRLLAETALPQLEAAVTLRRISDSRAELETIVHELYDLLERNRAAIVMLERSALELPELAQVFYREMRRSLVTRLEAYLVSRIKRGLFRPVPHPRAAARLILETVAIFAMHRHRDPDPEPVDSLAARGTVVHLIVSALAARKGARGSNVCKRKGWSRP
jgi:AcrR family transcriptional regulator